MSFVDWSPRADKSTKLKEKSKVQELRRIVMMVTHNEKEEMGCEFGCGNCDSFDYCVFCLSTLYFVFGVSILYV